MATQEEAHIAAYKLRNRRLGWILTAGIFASLLVSYLTRGVLFYTVFQYK
ncbi:MAG TPA: hypothetical protein V6D05_12175 [Stenomitos sp.]